MKKNVFRGKNKISLHANIQGSYVENCIIEDGVEVICSVIKDSIIKSNAKIGPFAYVRNCSLVSEGVRIGSFVEVKNSFIKKNTAVAHMSYIGDAEIGEDCNIGAGVVFCNYDGLQKHKSILGNKVFLGSNCNIVSPIKIEDNVFVASGTTISKSICAGKNVIGRVRQTEFNYKNKFLENFCQSPRWFGTDGIRGEWGKFLTESLVEEISKAILAKAKSKVLVGRDPRPSGKVILQIFKKQFMRAGVELVDVGVVSTPAIKYLTQQIGADFGVMITASHNPENYNGVKIFDGSGLKITPKQELELESFFYNKQTKINKKNKNNKKIIKNKYFLIKKYINFVKKYTNNKLSGLKIVLDCANGSASFFASKVFQELGADVVQINHAGIINQKCGALYPSVLQNAVLENKADLGFAFDGDADRVLMVNHNGVIFDGDDILLILAIYYKQKEIVDDLVVGTIMTNLGTEEKLLKHGIKLLRTPVGDKWVEEKMLEKKLFLGAEQVGHVLLGLNVPMGDGVLVARVLAGVFKEYPWIFDGVHDGKYIQVQKNIKIGTANPLETLAVSEVVNDAKQKLLEKGRVVVRKSGTENVLRVMVEGEDAQMCSVYAEAIAEAVKKEVGCVND